MDIASLRRTFPQALDEKTKADVLEKAEVTNSSCPLLVFAKLGLKLLCLPQKHARRSGSSSKKATRMADRIAKSIEKEKTRMASLKSDKDKDAFIRSVRVPSVLFWFDNQQPEPCV